MSDVLFTVTEEQLETGMRGFPVGFCPTSSVDPQKGLFYAGTAVSEMADWDPERVIYRLMNGKEGTLSEEFQRRACCSDALRRAIQQLPRKGHPMKLFCASLLLAGMLEGTGEWREDCLNLIARVPEIVACVICHHAGWGPAGHSRPEVGYMENFAEMLQIPGSSIEMVKEVFRLFNVLHYDHGGGNLSCFTGKAVASGLEDLYGSLSAAMAALAGPRHGKANQDCLAFVEEVQGQVGDRATAADVEKLIRHRLENNQLIFGFGHAVLRVEDPRATILYAFAKEHFPNHPLVNIALLLREVGPKVLKENPKISDPYPNVDAISGTVLTAAGFPYPIYYTVLFGLSRVVGIALQIVYERCIARDGKGTPIVRPKYLYRPVPEGIFPTAEV